LYRTLTAAPEENRPAKLGLVLAALDIASGKVDRVEESGDVYSFCWSPDAKRIAYTWRQTHEGNKEDVIDKETEAYVVLCDPDGKNRETITTVQGRGPMPGPRLWDWR
jgi:Tol biopolymer transport system component